MRYRVELEKRNSISPPKHVLLWLLSKHLTNQKKWTFQKDNALQFIPGAEYRHAHCRTISEDQVSSGSLIGLFPSSSCLILREDWNLVPNNTNIRVKKERYDRHSRLGAHFLSQDALRTTKETKTLDACIAAQKFAPTKPLNIIVN